MEKYKTEVSQKLIINSVIPKIDSELFFVNIKGYKRFPVYFMEVDSFIREFDYKLADYLDKFEDVKDKIEEAIDIGYDFEDMLSDYVKNLIEYGLITLSPENKL